MSTALLICEDMARSRSVIHVLEEDHDVWHVARLRDAMAWLTCHHPEMVVIDLELRGLDPAQLLDALHAIPERKPAIVGMVHDPATLPPHVADRLDQVIPS